MDFIFNLIPISLPMMVSLWGLIFFAGFIDSIAGGGGLISLPAYLFVGLPAHTAMACNKFSSSVGTTISTLRFLKNRAMDWKIGLISASTSFIAAGIATNLILSIDEKVVKTIFIFVIPFVAIFLLRNRKEFGEKNQVDRLDKKRAYIYAGLIGMIIGFYDGFVGPGTGTFAIIAYSFLMKYDLRTASGNAKVLNIASNYASLLRFLFSDKIIFALAIPTAIAGLLGNYTGSGLAIKKGSSFIRPIMICVIILIFVKIFLDLIVGII